MVSGTHFASFAVGIVCLLDASAFGPVVSSPKTTSRLNAYVPDGLTADQYKKIKAEDEKRKGKNLGALGPRGFKSRSMQAWQQAYEKGLATHNFASFGYREQLQNGTFKKADVPYMVRGGSWDNSDIYGVRRLPWLKSDKEYAKGGYKKEQSVSILGSGPGLDWAGTRSREMNLGNERVPGFS
ncbi:hypothetical protein IV203_002888 [Nitzschia inconspicua]|uniref:Uncharacterized protein n=1 Tax=Nitzschia inconspicua TaxID=303405 RepID=A0A9K3PN78_9STRA|nr:hypothetical protein IV203_002888 [Nitzschia inconspicua]